MRGRASSGEFDSTPSLVTDGVFSADPQDPTRAEFHPATKLDAAMIKAAAHQMRHRGLRWLVRHGHLDAAADQDMGEWRHDGGWSVDASAAPPHHDRPAGVMPCVIEA